MIALDASVLIAQLGPDDALHERATAAFDASEGEPLSASIMSIAETLVGPTRIGQLTAAREALARLEVSEVPLAEDAAERLAALRVTTGLKLPDCCVLLAAQDTGAKRVLTFDDRLAAAADELGF